MSSSELIPVDRIDVALAAEVERDRFMPVMQLQQAAARREAIAQVMSKLMKPEHDYGKVPGAGNKPTLLQPGAQKLDSVFGLVARYNIEEREEDWTGERHAGEPFFRYLVRCQLCRSDFVMGEAIGECNSWESKYRYRTAERKCPKCGAGSIIKTKKNSWWCAPFKGGCGQGFPINSPDIVDQETGRKPNAEIFDQVNTLLKMAQKRAHVAATINATSASEFFTQDLEDQQQESGDAGTTQSGAPDQGNGSSKSNAAAEPGRPVPEELQGMFTNIDKDSRHISEAFKILESGLAEQGGANGVTEYARIVKAWRDKFPKGSQYSKDDVKTCLLDLFDAMQTIKRPEGFAASDDDLPGNMRGAA